MKFKKIIALLSAVVMIASVGAINAFATNIETESDNEVAIILEKINSEYGTNIHILSEEELEKYGLNSDNTSTVMATYENVNLEETLRNIAETKIPEFERTTQETIAAIESIGIDTNAITANTDNEISMLATNPVIATKAINYAIAGAESSIARDSYGNAIWGPITNEFCTTNIYQDIWFFALDMYVKHIDRDRTLYWTGTGDYCAYINGEQYYLYSGTQYASMYVSEYV